MKKQFLSSLLAVAALMAMAWPCALSAQAVKDHTVSTSATGTTNAEVIFPGDDTHYLRLTCLDVKTDLTTSTLKLYGGSTRVLTTIAGASGDTNLTCASTTTFASNDVCVIQLPDDTVISRTVWGTNATNISFTATMGAAIPIGSTVWRMSTVNTINVETTNATHLSSQALFGARKRSPLLIRQTGTSACSVQNATVFYDP